MLNRKPRKEGVEKLIESGDITIGTAPKTTKTKPKVDPEFQAMEDQNKMFQDFSKRIETDEEIIARMNKQNKEAVERLKKKKEKDLADKLKDFDGDPDAMAMGGRIGMSKGGGIINFIKSLLNKKKSPSELFKEDIAKLKSKFAKEDADELKELQITSDTDPSGFNFSKVGEEFKKKIKERMDKRRLLDFDTEGRKPNATGGRIEMSKGGGIIDLLKFFSKKSPFQAYKDYLASVKRRAQTEPEKLAPELGAVTAGGIFTNRRMKDILEEGNEQQKERLLEEFIAELDKDPFYIDRPELKDKAIEQYTETLFGEKKAYGGRIGFDEGGPSSKGRRNFLKLVGGLASIPVFGKLFKAAKPAAKIAEVAKEVTSGVPAYFTDLIYKIKLFGEDITKKAATTERQKVTQYKGYELTEDMTTGKKQIKIGDAEYGQEEYMIYDPPETIIGKNNKPVEIPAQYDEVTVKPDMDGKMKDVESGLDSYDEILKEVRMKKSGGGVAYMLGE